MVSGFVKQTMVFFLNRRFSSIQEDHGAVSFRRIPRTASFCCSVLKRRRTPNGVFQNRSLFQENQDLFQKKKSEEEPGTTNNVVPC